MASKPVQADVYGNNSDLIAEVARLYLEEHHLVADVTWGSGVFWKKLPWANVTATDLYTLRGNQCQDFRATLHHDHHFDRVVFDPPYSHTGKNNSQVMIRAQYRLDSIASFNNRQILNLYRGGMEEAMRIVKPGGRIWVKTKPEVESGRQRWNHHELWQLGTAMGLYLRDEFVLVPHGRMVHARWRTQRHARKNLSFLLVFDVPKAHRKTNAQQQVGTPALAIV
jgi:methylase of polypeptide subunit release factors